MDSSISMSEAYLSRLIELKGLAKEAEIIIDKESEKDFWEFVVQIKDFKNGSLTIVEEPWYADENEQRGYIRCLWELHSDQTHLTFSITFLGRQKIKFGLTVKYAENDYKHFVYGTSTLNEIITKQFESLNVTDILSKITYLGASNGTR